MKTGKEGMGKIKDGTNEKEIVTIDNYIHYKCSKYSKREIWFIWIFKKQYTIYKRQTLNINR